MASLSGISDIQGQQVMAQDKQCFYFYHDPGITVNDLDDTVSVESHYLGREIALKFHLVRELYTYEPQEGEPDAGKVYVMKPVLYFAINKLNEYFRKRIHSGTLSYEEAREKMSDFLDISLSLISQDTVFFEKALRASKSFQELEGVFSQVVIIYEEN